MANGKRQAVRRMREEAAGRRERELARYIVSSGATVRKAAAVFGVSKSTVHKDVTEKLRCDDPLLYRQVKEVLEKNKAERHLRGGEATREKYRAQKSR